MNRNVAGMVLVMAMGSGCLSWSHQKYTAEGDAPPKVEHNSWSAGIIPARSPIEAAEADEIGTEAKADLLVAGDASRGGYGVYGGRGRGFRPGFRRTVREGHGISGYRPFFAPPNRILHLKNATPYPAIVGINNEFVGEMGPYSEGYVVSNHPEEHHIQFCLLEGERGVSLYTGHQTINTNAGESGWFVINTTNVFKNSCPL